ncbi:transcriptional regulator [Streptomyces sp. NPDC001833]|uniref:transcriptional regulator n=1 Tax=Streptomyces sp. NPDC001833 TaxID=3154658 RepID=UPI003327D857
MAYAASWRKAPHLPDDVLLTAASGGHGNVLGPLGISEFDEHVYRLLLTRPILTPQDAAHTTGAEVERVRRALNRLADVGLARLGPLEQYRPLGPEAAVADLLSRRRLEAEKAFAGVHAAVSDLTDQYRAGRLRNDPGALVEVLTGHEVVMQRVEEMNRSVRSHIWILDKPPYVERIDGAPHSNDAERAATREWVERGVEIRSVYCPESMARPGRLNLITELAELGEQARLLSELPFKLHIVDKKVALLPLIGGTYDTVAVVHPSGLLDALLELYLAYWERAQPFCHSSSLTEPDAPTQEELMLLEMLKAGFKDQTIARRLGWSARTASRRIGVLMERLSAETRFQAGIEAKTRGWI